VNRRRAVPQRLVRRAGAVWAVGGRVRAAFAFTIRAGRITEIDLVMDPGHLAELEVSIN